MADPYFTGQFLDLLPLNRLITWCAFAMAASQLIFIANFFYSMLAGRRATKNPWDANTLEWTVDSPPPHENFVSIPTVTRGPYEYSNPEHESDFWPQVDTEDAVEGTHTDTLKH